MHMVGQQKAKRFLLITLSAALLAQVGAQSVSARNSSSLTRDLVDSIVSSDTGNALQNPIAPSNFSSLEPQGVIVHSVNSSDGQVSVSECPAGFQCAVVGGAPTPCAAGTYRLVNSSNLTCSQCPAGSMCPAQCAAPISCAQGWYSVGSAANCTACAPGTYSLQAGASACLQCPPGATCLGYAAAPRNVRALLLAELVVFTIRGAAS